MDETIRTLMIVPFSCRNLKEKIRIIEKGKPRPIINKHIVFNSKKICISDLYDEEIWLTADKNLDCIICWTCLLFPQMNSENKFCVAKLTDENFYSKILLHKKSVFHISGLLRYRLFIKEKIIRVNYQTNKKFQLKPDFERNYNILKRIIDIICTSVINVDEICSFNLFNVENCVNILTSLKCFDSFIDESVTFLRKCPNIITKTVEAIASAMKIFLKKEIKKCSYLSLILNRHSKNSKLSLILRYVYQGNIYERLIDIFDITDFDLLKEYILQQISEYDISTKLISLSCDGGILSTDNISNLLALLQKQSPFCLFVPCHFHDINDILEQKLCSMEECKLFFKTISSMKTFFQTNSGICELLDNFSNKKIPNLYNMKLSNAQFLRILKLYRRQLRAFFSYVAKHLDKGNVNEIANAITFRNVLNEYQAVFLTEAFYRLFSRVTILSDMLNNGSIEKVFDPNILNNLQIAVMEEKQNGFDKSWTVVIKELIEDCSPKTLEKVGKKETDALLELYLKAIDCVIEEINFRFKCAYGLQFLSVFDCAAHDKLLASDYQLKLIQQMHGDFIDKKQAVIEMKLLSSSGSIFGRKSVYEFLDILIKANLQDAFKNVYRMGEIILTMPCKPDSSKKQFSKLDVIDTCWPLQSNEPEMNALSVLYVEKDYLQFLQSQTDFYENVILKLREFSSEVVAMFMH